MGLADWELSTAESLSHISRKEADEQIQELKIEKYKQELYGHRPRG
jgi:hypothetical protein